MVNSFLILLIYRPDLVVIDLHTGNVDSFLDHLQATLDQIDRIDEFELFICGDMNIDYSQHKSPGYKKLKNFEVKYNLTQVITSPTRCTAMTNSILDLIFTNSPCISFASPLEVNISDHEPVVAIRKLTRQKLPKVSFTCRS